MFRIQAISVFFRVQRCQYGMRMDVFLGFPVQFSELSHRLCQPYETVHTIYGPLTPLRSFV